MAYFSDREANTSIPCPKCGKPLKIARSCHSVFFKCDKCKMHWPLGQFINHEDAAMEKFLDGVYLDRI